MKRNSVPVILSVLLGACVCVLFAVLVLGGGYTFFMRSDSQPTQQSSATIVPNASSAAVAIVTPSRVAVPSAAPTFAPNPLNVQVKVDSKITASAVISATGGTLSVQGADGTKFTLTFPKDALASEQKITLTPITAVDGLPFSGGLVGGVQMSPEGLRLLQPAMLTIESPKTVAAKGFETVAFAYHQNGEGLYLNDSGVKGNVLTLEVWHFSGAGSAQGTSAEIQAQQQRVPSNAEDAFTQRVRDYLARERQAQLMTGVPGQNPDPDMERTIGEFLREAYDRFIAPQLPTALQDCEAARPILSKALGWLRQVQLLGYGDRFQTENNLIMETMSQALVNCYNKEYDQCVIDKNIAHRTTMVAMLRQAALLGIDGQLDQSKILKCPPRSYQISWQDQGTDWSGVVCSLDQPFTVTVLSSGSPRLELPFKFVPTSSQAGTVSYDVNAFGTHWTGSGAYTVQDSATASPHIVGQIGDGCATTSAGQYCKPFSFNLTLTPLGTSCQ
jgi:hypothetical protein